MSCSLARADAGSRLSKVEDERDYEHEHEARIRPARVYSATTLSPMTPRLSVRTAVINGSQRIRRKLSSLQARQLM